MLNYCKLFVLWYYRFIEQKPEEFVMIIENGYYICEECGHTISIEKDYPEKDADIVDLIRGRCHRSYAEMDKLISSELLHE